MFDCSLLAVGDELLDGRTIDTNSDFITAKLESVGARVVMRLIVGDDKGNIGRALALALRISHAVIVTGGLGPTGDDLTREAVSEALELPLHRDRRLEELQGMFFAAMGREMSPTNLKQADLIGAPYP